VGQGVSLFALFALFALSPLAQLVGQELSILVEH
jgi:hypothetical protein